MQGSFSCAEGFAYSGLVLVAGSGSADIGGSGCEIHGGLFVVSVTDNGGRPATGTPSFSIGGLGSVTFDADAIRMALGLLPPSQTSYREITGLTDPDK